MYMYIHLSRPISAGSNLHSCQKKMYHLSSSKVADGYIAV